MKDQTLTPQKTGEHKIGTKEVEGYIIGRDKKVVPPVEVEKLAALGCKDREIADFFGVNEATLRFNFKENLLKGRCELKQSLRRAMLNSALNGNVVMMIWLSKNYLDMNDNGHGSEDLVLPWIEREDQVEDQENSQDTGEAI